MGRPPEKAGQFFEKTLFIDCMRVLEQRISWAVDGVAGLTGDELSKKVHEFAASLGNTVDPGTASGVAMQNLATK